LAAALGFSGAGGLPESPPVTPAAARLRLKICTSAFDLGQGREKPHTTKV
jgi:hypothetical protein